MAITIERLNVNYNSLTNKPSLFSGAYSALSGKPTLGTLSDNDEGADASIVIPAVATITVTKGVITAVV